MKVANRALIEGALGTFECPAEHVFVQRLDIRVNPQRLFVHAHERKVAVRRRQSR